MGDILPAVMGCNPCGVRSSAPTCWMCQAPTVKVPALDTVMTSKEGAYCRHPDAARSIALHGPTLSDDPCGGGPL